MKMKAIAAICKRQKRFYLFDSEVGEQWLGDGCAIYPLFKMPQLNEQNIYTIFDIPERQQSKMYFTQGALPEGVNFEDTVQCENILEPAKMEIGYAGKVLRPLLTSQGLIFIDVQYLEPLSDVADMIELYERVDRAGKAYIVAKTGFILMAVIMPYDVITKDFVEQLKDLTRNCNLAFSASNEQGGAE